MPDPFAEVAQATKSKSAQVDALGLAAALRAQIGGEVRDNVRFDRGTRALYATDGSNYRQIPIGIVLPRDADDVLATAALCRRFSAAAEALLLLANAATSPSSSISPGTWRGFSKSIPSAASPACNLESCSTIFVLPPRSTISLSVLTPPLTIAALSEA